MCPAQVPFTLMFTAPTRPLGEVASQEPAALWGAGVLSGAAFGIPVGTILGFDGGNVESRPILAAGFTNFLLSFTSSTLACVGILIHCRPDDGTDLLTPAEASALGFTFMDETIGPPYAFGAEGQVLVGTGNVFHTFTLFVQNNDPFVDATVLACELRANAATAA